jgi:hypothetical protein
LDSKREIARLEAAVNLDASTLFIQQHWSYHCRYILILVSSMLIVEFMLCFVEIMHSNSRGLKLVIRVQAIHYRVQVFSNDLWEKEVLKKVEYCLSYAIAKSPALQSDPMFPEHVQYFSRGLPCKMTQCSKPCTVLFLGPEENSNSGQRGVT